MHQDRILLTLLIYCHITTYGPKMGNTFSLAFGRPLYVPVGAGLFKVLARPKASLL